MMENTRPYLTTLTPLRGIAAMFVAIFHSNLILKTFINPFGAYFVGSSWLWVDFFFVLSGFILCYVYGDNFKSSLTLSLYWKYLKARFARVYPLHFITLVWCLICAIIIRSYADGSFTPSGFEGFFREVGVPIDQPFVQKTIGFAGRPSLFAGLP
jgi:peptidoglycan/LPS O-acetylase OafA/YrhL